MRPAYTLWPHAPGIWRGWGFFKDETRAYEWKVEVTDLLPLARYAHVFVDDKRWTPPVPQDQTANPRHAH